MTIKQRLRRQVIRSLARVKLLKSIDVASMLEVPPQPEFGDLAFPCFTLAEKLKKSPQHIAQQVVQQLKLPNLIAKAEARAGYINFFFDWTKIAGLVLKEVERGVKLDVGKGRKVMVEYVSANPLHPLHVGALRNAVLGNSLVNILKATGYEVVSHFYVNDMGAQAAELVYGYIHVKEKPKEKIDHWLGKIYALTDRFIANDERTLDELRKKWPRAYQSLIPRLKKEKIKKELRELLRRGEAGEASALKKFREVAKLCLKGFRQTLKELAISFDSFDFESDFVVNGSVYQVVERLKEKGHLKLSPQGTWFLDLSSFSLPSLVLVRSDGTTLYLTRDIAYHVWKFKRVKVVKTVNVVGAEQALVQNQLKAALSLLGMQRESNNVIHFSYGHVRFPGVRMSARRGQYLTIDELLNNAFEKALKEVEKRNPKLSKKKKETIARAIAKGAIVYTLLKVEPSKEITFDLSQALRFEGDTGPYLQYAHTRCCGILRKAGKWKRAYKAELNSHERDLVRLLLEFPQTLKKASLELRSHYLCKYAYELATSLSLFYQFCPVLKATPEVRNFRLTLIEAVRTTLQNVLGLLGIEAPEVM
jgi:arginyl-tRNA synthetase